MLGFRDGTKDGGYLMANFSIYKAKEDLTPISREYGIDVVFLMAAAARLQGAAVKHITSMHHMEGVLKTKKYNSPSRANREFKFWNH